MIEVKLLKFKVIKIVIKFKQAKNELLKITNNYLSRHFEK